MTDRITPTPELKTVIFWKGEHLFALMFGKQTELTRQVGPLIQCGLLTIDEAESLYRFTLFGKGSAEDACDQN